MCEPCTYMGHWRKRKFTDFTLDLSSRMELISWCASPVSLSFFQGGYLCKNVFMWLQREVSTALRSTLGLWTFTGTYHKFNLLTLNISISSSPFFVCHTFLIIVIWEFGVWLKNHLLVIFSFTLITCVHDIVLKLERETDLSHSWVWKGHQTNETS